MFRSFFINIYFKIKYHENFILKKISSVCNIKEQFNYNVMHNFVNSQFHNAGFPGFSPGGAFDFDNAPLYTSLPINLTVNNITAHLSATGQGYSIQNANVMGFTPQGFAGRIIYPNSINLSDLLISFDQTLSEFSIMYACQELGLR
ncbi:MAG: hypothetical protein IPN57_03145 [Ignavibacteria bacterium]|nr:hypothetical protein [Ignavibacteria bacterium]